MFEDSLVESGGRLARPNPWTTTISFAGQTVLLAGMLLLSLLCTDVLPMRTLISSIEAPPSPPPAAAPVQRIRTAARGNTFSGDSFIAPSVIPLRILEGNPRPDEAGNDVQPTGMPYGMGSGNRQVVELLPAIPPIPPVTATQSRVRVSSGVVQGLLIRQVRPQYPPLARQARIHGMVVLQAVIDKDGSVQELHVVSGHPLLTEAAIAAVKQWLYRPYCLDGEPVTVETQINVSFTLGSE